jgi:pyrimidine operon attenuation protein/uracil phosphoribosyltransferase
VTKSHRWQIARKSWRKLDMENIIDEESCAGRHSENGVVIKTVQKARRDVASQRRLMLFLDKRNQDELRKKLIFKPGRIIVDDVVNSGKTLLYSVKPFLEFQPKKIQTLVLVERSHNNFPVQSDYVGLSISTTLQEHIFVEVQGDEITGAYLQ